MRKINVGVSVAPPNVVHTSPYVAKELGFFAKRCIDANIIQFEGGQSATSNVGRRAGLGDRERQRRRHRPRHEGAADLGLRAAHAAGLHGAPGIKTAAELKGKRLSATGGGVGGFNWRMGREVLQDRRPHGRRCAVHSLADCGPPAGPDRRPDRRRRAASGGRLSRQEAEADAECPGAARRADAELHVQRLRRLDRLDRARPRRCCATPWPR